MKKAYTKALIFSLLCAIITIFLCFIAFKYHTNFNIFSATEKVVNETKNGNPGDGEYFLIAGGLSVIGGIGALLVLFILIFLLPGIMSFAIFILQAISRLVQIGSENKCKNITCKVFTYISIILEIVLCIDIFIVIISTYISNKFSLIIVLLVNILCIIFYFKGVLFPKKATPGNINTL